MGLDAPIVDLSAVAENARGASVARTAQRLEALPRNEDVRRAAEEFEAVFLGQMLAPMFEEIGNDPLFGGGPGEQIYRAMLVEEYGRAIAKAGGLGIADAVQQELLSLQEAAAP
jgi:Rod binding domain-containing protein